jgi:CHASE2 domain-containing sensor protein
VSVLKDTLFRRREKIILAETILAFAFFYFDPLGLASQRAQSIDRWMAWFGQYQYASKVTDKLAVMLIDEESLRHWQTDWPISYRQIAGVIHQLSCARVVAVYFDFTLSRKFNLAEGGDDLLAAAKDSSATDPACADGTRPSRIPVFFSKAEGIDTPLSRELDRTSQTFWIETEAADGVYPAGRVEFPDHPVSDEEVTPAFGILRHLCSAATNPGNAMPSVCSDEKAAYSLEPLLLTWSGAVNPKQGSVSDTSGCRQQLSWWELPFIAAGWSNAEFLQRCPPILTLSASDLYRDYNYITVHGGDPAAVLAGRIVLVGTFLSALDDAVVSPVHGRLAGVYQHAVALDNLITFGSHYPTQPSPTEKYVSVALLYLLAESARFFIGSRKGNSRVVTRLFLQSLPYVTMALFFLLFACFVVRNAWPISLICVAVTYYLGPIFVDFWSRYFPRRRSS